MTTLSQHIFLVKVDTNNGPEYTAELFYKPGSNPFNNTNTMRTITMEESKLQDLTKENFGENTNIGVDLEDSAAFRAFISSLYFMKAKVRNLTLMSFDQEDTLTCQKWSIDMSYDFSELGNAIIKKAVEYSRIHCETNWRTMIDYAEDESGIKIRQREAHFFNFISLMCNLFCFYFVVTQITRITKYNMLQKVKLSKMRWISQRKNAVDFTHYKTLLKPDFPESEYKNKQELDLPTIILIVSNSFLLLANVLIILSLSSINISEFDYNRAINTFLGLGCCMCWMNMLTIVSNFEELAVVARSIKKTFKGVTMLLVGVLPIYFAFLFGGYCMFHEHEKFDTLTKTNVTLNAILAGDEILDFIKALMEFDNVGFIYAMAFCILFLVCIHNVFIYVVSEAFKEQAFKYEKQIDKKPAREKTRLFERKLTYQENLDPQAVEIFLKSAISTKLIDTRQVVRDAQHVDKIKMKIFNKIIPQSRDTHIIEMNLKKDIIREDIHFLKESIQNLIDETLEESNKAHLLTSTNLYIDFLLKRLERYSRSLIEQQDDNDKALI